MTLTCRYVGDNVALWNERGSHDISRKVGDNVAFVEYEGMTWPTAKWATA